MYLTIILGLELKVPESDQPTSGLKVI